MVQDSHLVPWYTGSTSKPHGVRPAANTGMAAYRNPMVCSHASMPAMQTCAAADEPHKWGRQVEPITTHTGLLRTCRPPCSRPWSRRTFVSLVIRSSGAWQAASVHAWRSPRHCQPRVNRTPPSLAACAGPSASQVLTCTAHYLIELPATAAATVVLLAACILL